MELWTVWLVLIFLTQLPGIKAQECGVAPLNSRIVGGENATEGSWPWQVSLHVVPTNSSFHICGATILNEHWVLTAAHCIITPSPSSYRLYFGKQTQSGSNPNEVIRNVSQIIIHSNYSGSTFTNDIALMKLSNPITYNNYIRPVCLAANTSHFNNGTSCWATGWGRLSHEEPLVAHDVLQEVQIPMIGKNLCSCIYSYFNIANLTDNMICAGTVGKGICQGDSGGPVQCKQGNQWIQAGISSFGIPCARGIPEVFARVSYFQSWITENTNGTNVSFIQYNSSGTDGDSSFVCPVSDTPAPLNSTTVSTNSTTGSTNSTTSSASSWSVPSELTFAGTVAMVLLMPLFA